MIGNAAQVPSVDVQTQKYLTLLELSKAITSHRDLSELFHDIACRLRNLFPFRDLAVMLHDGKRDVMRSYFFEGCEPTKWADQKPTEVPIDDSINGHVWRDQRAMIISDLDQDRRFSSAQILRDKNVKSVCCLPLSTVNQHLGTLNLWSDQIGAYDNFDLSFAQLVTSQIAVAVESQFYREQLARERDRSQLLLKVNNTLVTNLNLRELLSSISTSLGAVMPHEAAALALHDETLNELRVAAFDFPEHESTCATGKVIPFEGNPVGEAFTNRRTVLIDYEPSEANHLKLASGCASPLIFRDRVLGVLAIKSTRPHAFSPEDGELFEQVANQVAIAVENALSYNEIETLKNKLEKEKLYLEEEIRSEYNFEEIIGNSPVLKRVLQNVQTVATTNSTVLIYGETGTGKELLAHAIHKHSTRHKRPLVKINCAALPAPLIESELFGHEKGAFTGAGSRRPGRFEIADGGTIFLDEVGELPLDLQAKLLRVLEEGEFEQVGSSHTISVDVRVIAATNRNLAEAVHEGTFRSDLYYRLSVFPITVPPLRERREDIPMLVTHLVKQMSAKLGKSIEAIPKDVMTALTDYSWPGNIRELRNVIERAAIITQGPKLMLIDRLEGSMFETEYQGGDSDFSDASEGESDSETLAQSEYNLILRTLKKVHWRIEGPSGAADLLRVHPSTLRSRMKKLGISRPKIENAAGASN